MVVAVVVLLIVCIHDLMMLERNGTFLSKIDQTDTYASIMFSSEPSDFELYVACFASVWSNPNLWDSLREMECYPLDFKRIATVHNLNNLCIRGTAVGPQESCISYTLIFPRTFLSILVHLSFSRDLLLSGTWAWFSGKKEALKITSAIEGKEFHFKCLFLF